MVSAAGFAPDLPTTAIALASDGAEAISSTHLRSPDFVRCEKLSLGSCSCPVFGDRPVQPKDPLQRDQPSSPHPVTSGKGFHVQLPFSWRAQLLTKDAATVKFPLGISSVWIERISSRMKL